jgi:hypothetical protein
LSGDFEGYVASQVPSTSYQETADLLQLFAISRLSNSSLLELWTSTGDSSIKSLFSRTKDRLDADIVQLLSINSEFGVKPYTGDNYGDDNLSFTNNPVGPTMGLFFSANTISRDLITPGRITFQDSTISFLTNYYGFGFIQNNAYNNTPKSQSLSGFSLSSSFEIRPYDQIRFMSNESQIYTVMSTDILYDYAFGIPISDRICFVLDREIQTGTNINDFTIRRLVDDPGFIIINNDPLNVSQTGKAPSCIIPKYASETLKKNLNDIIQNLYQKNLI